MWPWSPPEAICLRVRGKSSQTGRPLGSNHPLQHLKSSYHPLNDWGLPSVFHPIGYSGVCCGGYFLEPQRIGFIVYIYLPYLPKKTLLQPTSAIHKRKNWQVPVKGWLGMLLSSDKANSHSLSLSVKSKDDVLRFEGHREYVSWGERIGRIKGKAGMRGQTM